MQMLLEFAFLSTLIFWILSLRYGQFNRDEWATIIGANMPLSRCVFFRISHLPHEKGPISKSSQKRVSDLLIVQSISSTHPTPPTNGTHQKIPFRSLVPTKWLPLSKGRSWKFNEPFPITCRLFTDPVQVTVLGRGGGSSEAGTVKNHSPARGGGGRRPWHQDCGFPELVFLVP